MRKSSNIIVTISSILIVIGVVVGSVVTKYSSEISTVVTTITAIIGAVALWIQFKKDREINQASFVVEFYKSFSESSADNDKVLEQLDNKFDNKSYTPLKQMHKEVLSYIYWLRTLCSLIERNVFSFDVVDDMFAYKFFSLVNNKEVQEMEFAKYKELYKPIYRIHRRWNEYRKKHGLSEIYQEESLSLVEGYEQYSK